VDRHCSINNTMVLLRYLLLLFYLSPLFVSSLATNQEVLGSTPRSIELTTTFAQGIALLDMLSISNTDLLSSCIGLVTIASKPSINCRIVLESSANYQVD